MDGAPGRPHTRILVRELRRGLSTCGQALFVWARDEPHEANRLLAQAIGKAILQVAKAMAAWNGDGAILPGDSRRLPHAGARPPHDFTR